MIPQYLKYFLAVLSFNSNTFPVYFLPGLCIGDVLELLYFRPLIAKLINNQEDNGSQYSIWHGLAGLWVLLERKK
jgi:hypothetical protein